MKKLLLLASVFLVLSCSEGEKNTNNNSPDKNVEKYSEENITPQVDYDTTDQTVIDTISSAKGAKKQDE